VTSTNLCHRHCPNRYAEEGRNHSRNNIYFECDVKTGVIWQKCFSKHCDKKLAIMVTKLSVSDQELLTQRKKSTIKEVKERLNFNGRVSQRTSNFVQDERIKGTPTEGDFKLKVRYLTKLEDRLEQNVLEQNENVPFVEAVTFEERQE
jgi:hypothetical protein